MWKKVACYLSGRHEYGVCCESGMIYLRCPHCGKRTSGWAIHGRPADLRPRATRPSKPARAEQSATTAASLQPQSAVR